MDTRTDTSENRERSPLVIRRVDAIPVGLPLKKAMGMAGSTVSRALNILVRIEAADGTVGWGEAASAPTMTGDTLGGLVSAVRDHLAPMLVGEDAWRRPALCRKLRRALYGNSGAHSAIELALLDLAGQASGLPLVDLIGGAVRFEVAPMWLLGNPTAEQDIVEAHGKRAEGFGFFKLKIGTKPVETEIAATLALRDALGAEMPLCADANCGLSFDDAQRYLEGTREAGLMFVEQPLAHDDLAGLARLTRLSPTLIGADEGIHSLADIEEHKNCGVGGVSLKLIKLGGVSAAVEAAAALPAAQSRGERRRQDRRVEHRLGGGDPPRLRGTRGRVGREPHAFLSRRGCRPKPARDRRRRGGSALGSRARHRGRRGGGRAFPRGGLVR